MTELEKNRRLEVLLHNSIVKWMEDSYTAYDGLSDPDFIERVCEETGMTEDEYETIVMI